MQTQKSRDGNPKSKVVNLAIVVFVMLLPWPHLVEAQQPKKVPRIAYLAQRNPPTPTTPDPAASAFQQGLRDLGYVEGKNILVEYRYAAGSEDRLRALLTELVQQEVDVLVSPTFQGIRAAKQTTKTIPIVMVVTVDPVASGLIDSLARPGGQSHRCYQTDPRIQRKAAGIAQGGGADCAERRVLRDADATAFIDYEIPAGALK